LIPRQQQVWPEQGLEEIMAATGAGERLRVPGGLGKSSREGRDNPVAAWIERGAGVGIGSHGMGGWLRPLLRHNRRTQKSPSGVAPEGRKAFSVQSPRGARVTATMATITLTTSAGRVGVKVSIEPEGDIEPTRRQQMRRSSSRR
jgi:hypothetical protein